MKKRRLAWLTSSRADWGKLKVLYKASLAHFDNHLFITDDHLPLASYREVLHEISSKNITITKSISSVDLHGFSGIIIHGDRLEALRGALRALEFRVPILHVEGGEVSGTLDEMCRHAITKLAYAHFVTNQDSMRRVLNLGESNDRVFLVGSPEVDIMNSPLPGLTTVLEKHSIKFKDYAVLIYHPTDEEEKESVKLFRALVESNLNYIWIRNNQDRGSERLERIVHDFAHYPNFKIVDNMPVEEFYSLLRGSRFLIGNSSTGVREAPALGVPSIDIGNRQAHRGAPYRRLPYNKDMILDVIINCSKTITARSFYGFKGCAERFIKVLLSKDFWNKPYLKRITY